MQIKCRNCDEVIPAESINIQEMVALCPSCSHVFPLDKDVFARKAKAHKVKRPEGIQVDESSEQFTIAYRRLYGSGTRMVWALVTLLALFYTAIMFGAGADGAPPGAVLFIGALAAVCWYLTAVFATTKMTITLDDHDLAVARGPLPVPFREDNLLDVTEINRITIQQSNESRFPATLVVAEFHDGARANVVRSLPHEAARYVAHVLDNYLHETGDDLSYELDELDADADLALTADGELDPAVAEALDDVIAQSQQAG